MLVPEVLEVFHVLKALDQVKLSELQQQNTVLLLDKRFPSDAYEIEVVLRGIFQGSLRD